DEELESMRNKNARYVNIEDRAVKDKDIIRLDFEGKKDGVPFDGGKAENYSLIIGSKSFIEGFEEQLIGMKLGEEKVINVTFPQDYMEKTLAGAEVTFDVKINEIQEKQLPELDDEFVKDVSEFDTLDELKEDIKKSIQSRKEAKAVSEFENEIIDTIVKNTSMDLPVEMIDSEVEHMMNEFSQGLAYQGMDINMYLGYINKTADDLKNEMRGEAEKRVKGSMVLEKIRDIENISYQEEQLEEELSKIAKQYNMDLNKLKEILPEEQKQYIIDSIRTKNTIDFLNKQTKRV
ncbi:MAG: trigger factor, partial [Lachnospiraceae bacterium]